MQKKQALWTPTQESIDNSNITDFRNYVNAKFGINLDNYEMLYDWSINYIVNFWHTIAEYSQIQFRKPPLQILKQKAVGLKNEDLLNYKWFDGAKMNFAENLLRFKNENVALIQYNEYSETKKITFNQLYNQTAKVALALKNAGVVKGDRVAGFISNCPEAVIAMLATISLGAIWSSCSPDFGASGVEDRFQQIEPKILIAVDGYMYNGKIYNTLNIINEVVSKLNDLEKVVVIPAMNLFDKKLFSSKFVDWNEFVNLEANKIEFVYSDFNHPVYIMYSSGTTGVPKCIVHGAGGTLLQHYKELALHTNLKPEDTIFYFTTCGWMMWNWLVSSLFIGSTVVLFDGSPAYPNLNRLWEMAETEKITIFGTSPKFLTTCMKADISPIDNFDLTELRVILSTGSPLAAENFEWVYSKVKKDIQLSSISGGTDIISCFMLGNPVLPVYSEEIQCRGLGMKVEAFSENGESLIEEKGELVCTLPFPSMPVFFWNDEDESKYRNAYFDYFTGIWRHGDYIKITQNGGVVVYGRSDATLNPGGVRIGTSELYRVVESIPEILDSIVVGQSYNNDVRILLFVVLRPGFELDTQFIGEIKNKIKHELTPRHIPEMIFKVNEVPHTINGKKVELAVLKTLNNEEVKNIASLANPESLKQFEGILNIN